MESTCGKAAMSYELKKDAMRTILTWKSYGYIALDYLKLKFHYSFTIKAQTDV